MEFDYLEVKEKLVAALKDFFASANKSKAVIGLSGGIDSSVSACLSAEALGATNVYAINLATRFNSSQTKANAKQLAENLEVNFAEVDIDPIAEQHIEALERVTFGNQKITLTTLDKENLRARTRGSTYLAALAGSLDALILNNGNKTEFTFGYATLYGDLVGAVCPLGDLLKGDVYELAKAINKSAGKQLIPQATFDIKPSAELSADQNIEEGKGDPFWYPFHDQLVFFFTEQSLKPEEIINWAKEGKLEEKTGITGITEYFGSEEAAIKDIEDKWNQYRRSEFKRFQAPPVISVRSELI